MAHRLRTVRTDKSGPILLELTRSGRFKRNEEIFILSDAVEFEPQDSEITEKTGYRWKFALTFFTSEVSFHTSDSQRFHSVSSVRRWFNG